MIIMRSKNRGFARFTQRFISALNSKVRYSWKTDHNYGCWIFVNEISRTWWKHYFILTDPNSKCWIKQTNFVPLNVCIFFFQLLRFKYLNFTLEFKKTNQSSKFVNQTSCSCSTIYYDFLNLLRKCELNRVNMMQLGRY